MAVLWRVLQPLLHCIRHICRSITAAPGPVSVVGIQVLHVPQAHSPCPAVCYDICLFQMQCYRCCVECAQVVCSRLAGCRSVFVCLCVCA